MKLIFYREGSEATHTLELPHSLDGEKRTITFTQEQVNHLVRTRLRISGSSDVWTCHFECHRHLTTEPDKVLQMLLTSLERRQAHYIALASSTESMICDIRDRR